MEKLIQNELLYRIGKVSNQMDASKQDKSFFRTNTTKERSNKIFTSNIHRKASFLCLVGSQSPKYETIDGKPHSKSKKIQKRSRGLVFPHFTKDAPPLAAWKEGAELTVTNVANSSAPLRPLHLSEKVRSRELV